VTILQDAIDGTGPVKLYNQLTNIEKAWLPYIWDATARPEQLPPPGTWTYWLYLAGRGAGKSRSGAEWVRKQVEQGKKRIALVGPTAADTRDVMIEGESGLMSVCPPWDLPEYEPSKRRVTWANGAQAIAYSGDVPDRLRGPQHDAAWVDELAAFKYPEAWDMMLMGLRLGDHPQAVITTTPRPTKIIKDLLKDPNTVVSRGTSFDNKDNLAPAFFEQIIKRYEGTRLGRQELYAEILEDVPGALWHHAMIDEHRVKEAPPLTRIVVGVDPAVTASETSDDTGIVVVGRSGDHFYVIDDATCHASPGEWAAIVNSKYQVWKADRVIGESNNGGDLIESVVRSVNRNISYQAVRATRGKLLRAEPVAALYEQGRVHHVGVWAHLEDQMCSYDPESSSKSPDRLDALVWAVTSLMDQTEIFIA
jgi:phage terminase large subunit-like protein